MNSSFSTTLKFSCKAENKYIRSFKMNGGAVVQDSIFVFRWLTSKVNTVDHLSLSHIIPCPLYCFTISFIFLHHIHESWSSFSFPSA